MAIHGISFSVLAVRGGPCTRYLQKVQSLGPSLLLSGNDFAIPSFGLSISRHLQLYSLRLVCQPHE